MSQKREVFTILEDDTSKEGVKLPARTSGTAVAGNQVPVLAGVKSDGTFKNLPVKAAGDAIGDAIPSLSAQDVGAVLRYLQQRLEGAAIAGVNALPILGFKDAAGNFKYPLVNADGELVISNAPVGTRMRAHGSVEPSAINTLTTIAEITLAVDEVYEEIMCKGSATFQTLFELVQVDIATITVLDSFVVGSGQYSFSMNYRQMEITAGASGAQKLRVRATQLQGSPSDCIAYVEALEKA